MTPREIRFGLDGFTGIAVVSVAAALASRTWTIAGSASGGSPVAAAMEAYVPPSPAPDITGLVNLPPFGKAALASAATTVASGNLTLHGILLANPATASTVLIATSGQDSVAYRIGQVLPNGATIDSIGVDYVMLRSGGQYMTLYFPDDPRAEKAGAAGAPAAPNAPPRGDLPPQPGESPPQPGGAPAQSGVEAIRALLPPSVVPRPAPPPQAAPPPPAPAQNAPGGNGLIDRPGAAVTPRQ